MITFEADESGKLSERDFAGPPTNAVAFAVLLNEWTPLTGLLQAMEFCTPLRNHIAERLLQSYSQPPQFAELRALLWNATESLRDEARTHAVTWLAMTPDPGQARWWTCPRDATHAAFCYFSDCGQLDRLSLGVLLVRDSPSGEHAVLKTQVATANRAAIKNGLNIRFVDQRR